MSPPLRIGLLLGTIGIVFGVDIQLEQKDSGFFMKPLSSKQNVFTQISKRLAITRPLLDDSKVAAFYGTFSASDKITRQMMLDSLGNHSEVLKHRILDDADISVHLVSRTIKYDWPILQVLFHSSQLGESASFKSATSSKSFKQKNNKRQKFTTTTAKPLPVDQPDPKWCLQLHVEKLGEEIRSTCLLDALPPTTCLSQVVIPHGWWHDLQPSVQVYFSVYHVGASLQCATPSNSIIPSKTKQDEKIDKVFVNSVTLSQGKQPYQEVQEDQHILVDIPQKDFYPGTKFHVPVKLQAESDVQTFVVKSRARHGLRIIGARASSDSWHVTVNVNHKQKNAMVSAYVKDKENYAKTDKKQEIFQWIFEVEDEATGTEPGRILFNIEYEMRSNNMEVYGVKNKVVARVHIQRDNIYTIVPVIKTTELINTAVLTGETVYSKLRIYGVNKSGKVTDVTAKTTCHSGNDKVLQVDQKCDAVFLTGKESKGSTSVNVIAKYEGHTKFLFFKVWYPEIPLDMELSDHKLSQIKGWKAPKYNQHISRRARGVEFGYRQHPGLLLSEEGARKEDLSTTCHLRFQQSVVKVFAKFQAYDVSESMDYLLSRRASFDVTDLVMDSLRIADKSIASLRGNVVTGSKTGRTEVQVVTSSGRCIGMKDIKVSNDKVTIKELDVSMVTGLSVHLEEGRDMPGTILAHTIVNSQLKRKYQEGFLDISVRFSDNTSLPLHHIPPSEYFLDMDTMNTQVIIFGPTMSQDRPKIIALGQGKGELLKLSLELGDSCQKKKTQPLAFKLIHIDVDFSKNVKDNGAQRDQVISRNSAHFKHKVHTAYGIIHVDQDTSNHHNPHVVNPPSDPIEKTYSKLQPDESNVKKVVESGAEHLPTSGVKEAEGNTAHHEAQLQHISKTRGMTPLEVGMYVLLGVFCLAIAVFLVNCVVFVVRYRKKRMPRDRMETIASAHDWVWIGRATLERNAVNTHCSKALMTEEDFNGNQNRTPPGRRGSNRNSACSNGSNRNSYVSTYKGSECSIRITSNPHPDASAPTNVANPLPQQMETADDDMEENGNGDRNGNTEPNPALANTSALQQQQSQNQTAASTSRPNSGVPHTNPTVRPHSGLLTVPGAASRPNNAARVSTGNTGNTLAGSSAANKQVQPLGGQLKKSSHLDFAWDYESMGMTYDQLMEYFDNLKESTA